MLKYLTIGGVAIAAIVIAFAIAVSLGTSGNRAARLGQEGAHPTPSPNDAVAGYPAATAPGPVNGVQPTSTVYPDAADAVRSYLAIHYGSVGATRTDWYGAMKSLTVGGTDTVIVKIDPSVAPDAAMKTCHAVESYIDSPDAQQLGLNSVHVVDMNGKTLVTENGKGAACQQAAS